MARARARLDTLAVRLLRIEVARFGASLGEARGGRPLWRLSFHERGRAALASADRVAELPPGRSVLISPELAADARPQGDARELAVLFELRPSRGGPHSLASEAPLVLETNALRDGLARGLLEQLGGEDGASASQTGRAQALVHLCLASALESAGSAVERATNGAALDARSQLQPALRYIDAHLGEFLPNAKLAELAHASESHFIRLFRRVLGRTPARHVQERRVATAAELLLGTGLTIDEIAERCGFANRYHFSRVFAQLMSHPPARFRTLHAERSERAGLDTSP